MLGYQAYHNQTLFRMSSSFRHLYNRSVPWVCSRSHLHACAVRSPACKGALRPLPAAAQSPFCMVSSRAIYARVSPFHASERACSVKHTHSTRGVHVIKELGNGPRPRALCASASADGKEQALSPLLYDDAHLYDVAVSFRDFKQVYNTCLLEGSLMKTFKKDAIKL